MPDSNTAQLSGSLSIVMPVYNEAEVIATVIRDYQQKVVNKLPDASFIIAEDGSTDGTKEVLAQLKEEISFVLISGEQRKGYTKAFKDALNIAKTDWIFFTDSDGQHDPSDVFKMISESKGYDIISGNKTPRRDPFHRVLISNVYNFLIYIMFGFRMSDIDSGFKLIRREVIEQTLPRVTKMKYCVMSEFIIQAYLAGFKIKEIPVNHYPRESGTTAIFHPTKLPQIIFGLVKNLFQIKAEHRKGSS